jgi:hypothetical protein
MQSELFTAFPDGMTRPPAVHTPGPYKGLIMGDTGNIRLYSTKTAEPVADVLSRAWGDDENAPDIDTAMKNFQLFRHAPAMLEALQAATDTWGEAFATGAPVSGADLVEWFAGWLESVRPVLAGAEGRQP